jgi:hypothetical protein
VTSIPSDGERNKPIGSLSNPTGERKISDWIQAFGEWALPRCDAPEQYVFWAAVYTIAAVLRRQVVIPKSILGSWECYPHLYVMFVGPPGMRKTTSMTSFAKPLLDKISGLRTGPTYFTKEILTEEIIKAPDSSVYLMVGEFADLMQKNKSGEMYDFLTSMYDTKDSLEIGTMMRGIQTASKPCLNMFSATTPAWISDNMSQGIIGGGFASRVLFVYADKLRSPRLVYTSLMKEHKTDVLEAALINDLIEIAALAGEVSLAAGMEDVLNEWNLMHATSAPVDSRFAGYHSRKPMMVLKLAMIRSISLRSDLVIREGDFRWALDAMESNEGKLDKIFGGIGKNEYVFDMDAIVGYILQNPGVEEGTVYNQFKNVATHDKFMELLRGCLSIGDVGFRSEAGKRYYYPIE